VITSEIIILNNRIDNRVKRGILNSGMPHQKRRKTMSKIDLLEERLKEFEEQKKEIETKIRNAKIEIRRLKASNKLKMFALKYNGNWKKK
jgi:predicted phage-related endonuclease